MLCAFSSGEALYIRSFISGRVLNIPKANLSQHLSVLKEAGILKARKEGTFQLLSLALPKIKDACQLVRGILSDRLNEEQKQMKELTKNLEIQKKKNSKKNVESRK